MDDFDSCPEQKARLIRDGVAQSYSQLIDELMCHAFGASDGNGNPKAEIFLEARERYDRLVDAATLHEEAIDRLRNRTLSPRMAQNLQQLLGNATAVRDTAVKAAERIIVSLSARISRAVPK